MFIRRLQVSHIRNLSRVSLPQLKTINVFYGANGSGKTSLLEAVHLLLVGRSFRHAQVKPVLQDGEAESVVFAELVQPDGMALTLGMRRERNGAPVVLLNGSPIGSLAELVHVAPVQVFSAEAFEIVVGGPSHRRQFLDWGLFHVEPVFFPAWRQAQRALKQRNTLLRHGKIAPDQLRLWTREYIRYGEQVDAMRQAAVAGLVPVAEQVLAELSPAVAPTLQLSYHRGWAKDLSLEEALEQAQAGDMQQGVTRVGPHRADLRILSGAQLAGDMLSRGQQKILVAGLQLAQAELLRQHSNKTSIFLIDDLGAELDREHRRRFCAMLERLGVQVLATSIEPTELIDGWSPSTAVQMFHVEHGSITQC